MKNKKAIIAIVCLILLIGIIAFIIYPEIKKQQNIKQEYYESERYELIEIGEHYNYERENIWTARNKDAYKHYLEIEKFKFTEEDEKELKEKDFDNFSYILVFYQTNSCGEDVTFKSADIEEQKQLITLNFKAKETCGVCALEYQLHEIKIPKKQDYYEVDTNWDIKDSYCDPTVAYKPILYLYPETTTNITVDFAKEENLTTTYPKFNKEWNITVHPNGDIYDKNNKYYYALYWEELEESNISFNEGFYVSKDNAIKFLEEKLSILGLNNKEKNEFIMYWLPILEKNKHSLVYFELTEELQNKNELIITPKPDTLIRIRMHVKKIDSKQLIKEQKLSKQERKGYTAIEWGGVIYN